MTTSADPVPARIPGYDGGPLTHRPDLLGERLFRLGHLVSCAVGSEDGEELLPARGDDDLPDDAAERLTSALRTLVGVEDPEALAPALLESQGPSGTTTWTTMSDGVRINDGAYSFRNPANGFALPPDRPARVSAALAP